MICSIPASPAVPEGGHVALQHRLERLSGLPLRVIRGELLDAVEGESELDVERLLRPERPVVVEDGEALRGRHVVRTGFIGDGVDEREDGPLRITLVP